MNEFLPYGKQSIDEDDLKAVVETLKSDWLTTGPKVEQFENAICDFTNSKFAIAVNSGTAALHSSLFAINIKKGDEVIVPCMTFASTANSVVMQGGTPVFVDVNEGDLLINPNKIEEKINKTTKAVIAVDYAGHAADYNRLKEITKKYNLNLIADACHAIGGKFEDKNVGEIADLSTFSFHPVKHITTGEGGIITTNNKNYYDRMKFFRNHGITSDHREREKNDSWFYEMIDIGYNYRISDIQCALGISQLTKLESWVNKRQKIAKIYDNLFKNVEFIDPLHVNNNISHAYHLYVVRINFSKTSINKADLFKELKKQKIGINVHYIPVHLHPYYKKNFNTKDGDCPVGEQAYNEIVSLPIFPKMSEEDVGRVFKALINILK